MSKNKKIVLASVGVLFILIATVLFIRSPGHAIEPPKEPPKQAIERQNPAPIKEHTGRDDSHEKVEKVIDSASNVVTEQAPGLWLKVVDTFNWFMEFDTKYALILLGFCLLVIAVLQGGSNKKKS